MSQQTMSQLASLASRPDPAADTLAHYQALPVAHHQLEEATYESEALDQQRAGAWEARAISAEAANRDLEARLSRVHEDRRDCESRLVDVTRERDRMATKVKTLERDVATLRKAKPAAQPAEAVERAEGAEAPAPPGDRGGASAAGVRYLLAGAQAWHAQAEACAGHMLAVSTGLRMVGCSVLGRGAEPPQFWVLLIWLEPGISHVTWVHYDATMCLPCIVCSILPVLHFLRFDLCVL